MVNGQWRRMAWPMGLFFFFLSMKWCVGTTNGWMGHGHLLSLCSIVPPYSNVVLYFTPLLFVCASRILSPPWSPSFFCFWPCSRSRLFVSTLLQLSLRMVVGALVVEPPMGCWSVCSFALFFHSSSLYHSFPFPFSYPVTASSSRSFFLVFYRSHRQRHHLKPFIHPSFCNVTAHITSHFPILHLFYPACCRFLLYRL